MGTDLAVVCMLWRKPSVTPEQAKKPYAARHVRGLRSMLQRASPGSRLVCVTNLDVEGAADEVIRLPDRVAALPSQFPKLWLHSQDMARAAGWGRRLLFTDLDVVAVGDWSPLMDGGLDPVFRGNYAGEPPTRPPVRRSLLGGVPRGTPAVTPPYSTSLFAYTTGTTQHIWDRFSVRRARRVTGWTGSDQRWVNAIVGPDARTWPPDERFAQMGTLLRDGTRPSSSCLVVTCGHVDPPWSPEVRSRLPWVAEYYPDEHV